MREESESIDLIHNTNMDTYKIFLKPTEGHSGHLGVRNVGRMITANNEHHDLFGDNVKRTMKMRGEDIPLTLPKNYKGYEITSIEDLFYKIFHDRRDPKTGGPATDVAFTYCYKSDGRLYLCNTVGPKDDAKCKHAWLCNKLEGIAAAGIMQFSKKGDTNIIYIDNLSGTYKTKDTDLDVIKDDFKNSFPGINIELLPSPGVVTPEDKYCDVMTSETVDYYKQCESTTSGGRKKKSKKKSKKKQTKKQRKKQRKTNKNFP